MSQPIGTGADEEVALWRSALDAFALGLVSAREALASDQVADGEAGERAPSWPPRALPTGPVPPRFEDEARALLAESDDLTKALLDAMDRNRVPTRRAVPRGGVTNHPRWSVQL